VIFIPYNQPYNTNENINITMTTAKLIAFYSINFILAKYPCRGKYMRYSFWKLFGHYISLAWLSTPRFRDKIFWNGKVDPALTFYIILTTMAYKLDMNNIIDQVVALSLLSCKRWIITTLSKARSSAIWFPIHQVASQG